MNIRLIGICLVAAVFGGFFAWALYGLAGGGGDDSAPPDAENPRTPGIVAFIPLQVEKLGRGAEAIYGVLDIEVQAQCSLEEFIAAMADQPPPGAFRQVKEIKYNDDGTADARIVLITESGDVEVTWKLSFLPNGLPKIVALPGMEECAPG